METIKNDNGEIRFREMFWHLGKCYKSTSFKRKTDARNWKNKKQAELKQLSIYGINPKLGDTLFQDYAKSFLQKKLGRGRSPSTHKSYDQRLRLHILPLFGKLALKLIRKCHGEELQASLLKTHNNKGVNLIVDTLKAVMLEAERDEYIVRTPLTNLKSLTESQAIDKFWTCDEINQFLRANQNDQYYSLYFLAIHTGMRRGELAGLKWSAINFQQRLIHVRATADRYGQREGTKTGKNRIIPMNDQLLSFLLKLFECKNSDFVFADENHNQIDAHHMYRLFRKAQVKAKMQNIIRFHDLRHTFASNFVMNSGSIYELQQILGHSKIDMSMRYTHHSPEFLARSSKHMDFGIKDESKIKTNLVNFNQPNHFLTIQDGKENLELCLKC